MTVHRFDGGYEVPPPPTHAAEAVDERFQEAAAELMVARSRHLLRCPTGACDRCELLAWSARTFQLWREPQIGSDDLDAAVWMLRSVRGARA